MTEADLGTVGRKGDFTQTASGRKFWPLDPRPEEVFVEDIAHALSNVCRFGGHSSVFYSVAEHSVHVASIVPAEFKKAALLHDAAEAYVGDMVRPIKKYLPEFEDYENRILSAIYRRFNVVDSFKSRQVIREADNAVLHREAIVLMRNPAWAHSLPAAAPVIVEGWRPELAQVTFLAAFEKLFGGLR